MKWQARLREMLVAGGTFTAVACGTQQGTSQIDSGNTGDATAGDDGNVEGGDDGALETSSGGDVTDGDMGDATLDGAGSSSGTDSGSNSGSSSSGCCNANPDPCCPYELCEAAVPGPACECSMDGGTWIPGQVDAASVCALPDGGSSGSDGSVVDAEAADTMCPSGQTDCGGG